MRCPTCGRDTPDALMVCRHCGADTHPSLLQRLWGRLRRPGPPASIDARPRVVADEDPLGIEMPAAGAKAISLTVSQVPTRSELLADIDRLDPGLRAKLIDAIATGEDEVMFEHMARDEGGDVTVSDTGTPLDPAISAAIDRLIATHPETKTGTAEQQIVVEVDGARQVYQSVDDLPPEARNLLGRFAEREISSDANGQ